MFEKYTEKARRAVFFARYEASQFGSPHIETEHFLLGILREDKALALLLLPAGSAESIRKEIVNHSTIQEKTSTAVDLPVSNESKRVLAYAAEEAERLGHKHIGTEHLFLGLLREDKCFAAKLLHDREVHLDQAREAIQKHDAESQARAQQAGPSSVSLSEFGIDLIQQAMDKALSPLVGREHELQRILQVLCRFTRGNPVLVGEPGVGKKTIVYGLAQRIAEDAAPQLDEASILSVDLAVIAAGTRSRSRFEDNLEHIRRELFSAARILVLFIDGLHTLANEHRFLNFANVIKPALLDRSIHCISTATPAEYAKTVEASPWLEQHFTVVEVKPPSETEAIQVLMGVKKHFENFHDVIYTDEAIQYAVFHSNSYFPNRYLPEKAIDLMDEAGARAKLRQTKLPDELIEVQKRIKLIVRRMENAIASHEFEKARFYSDEERKERENLRTLREKHHLDESAAAVTREDVEQIVAERTGLTLEFLRKSKLPGKA